MNEEMIRQGYAEARYLSPDDPIRGYYIQLEIEAEITKLGYGVTISSSLVLN